MGFWNFDDPIRSDWCSRLSRICNCCQYCILHIHDPTRPSRSNLRYSRQSNWWKQSKISLEVLQTYIRHYFSLLHFLVHNFNSFEKVCCHDFQFWLDCTLIANDVYTNNSFKVHSRWLLSICSWHDSSTWKIERGIKDHIVHGLLGNIASCMFVRLQI